MKAIEALLIISEKNTFYIQQQMVIIESTLHSYTDTYMINNFCFYLDNIKSQMCVISLLPISDCLGIINGSSNNEVF